MIIVSFEHIFLDAIVSKINVLFIECLCSVSGPNTMSEWLIEGRRLIPLMPRLVPQTAFTAKANEAANLQAEKNASMPVPSLTGNKDCKCSLFK